MQHLTRWSCRPSLVFLLTLSFFLLAASMIQAQSQPNAAGAVALHEGLVVDGDRTTIYLMNPEGGIDAVRLEDGAVQWSHDQAAKPLWISDTHLIAQAEPGVPTGALDVVVLDRNVGSTELATRIQLPTGVRGSVDDQLGKTFRVRAEQLGRDVVLSWTARQRPIKGTVKPLANTLGTVPLKKASRDFEGAHRFDLTTGQAESLRQRKATALPQSRLVELSAESGIAGVSGRQFLSVDGRHVLVSEAQIASATGLPAYRWTIYSRESGVFVGELDQNVSVSPFLVAGHQLLIATLPQIRRDGENFLDEPLKLRALDLQDGEELWSYPLRDTAYRGPFPP